MRLNFRSRWQKTSLVGLIAMAAVMTGVQGVAATSGDPYNPAFGTSPGTAVGYDVSYPQCSTASTPPPGSFSFGIAGVNGGRPFNNNTCLATEYSTASREALNPPSLYINTGYSGAYRKNITSDCASLSKTVAGSSSQRQAWAVGCSEAESSLTYATNSGAASVAMWWLDIETANSWSSSNLALNQYAINGAAARLAQTGVPVGVYSSASMWTTITGTGSFAHSAIAADWDASLATCPSTLGATGFSGDPVWLVQSTAGGVDSDTAC